MKYAIIEDEPLSRESLRLSMQRIYPQYQLVFQASTITETVEYLRTNPELDLMLMDIELADGNAFVIFQEIFVTTPIIFTTSYDEYALKAFKVHSIDYLLKPFSEADLSAAIAKFERHYGGAGTQRPDYSLLNSPNYNHNLRLRIEAGDNYRFVNLDEVSYFISEDKYVFAKLNEGRRVLTNFQNLQDLEAKLPATDFFRVSRNIIASISSIKSVSKYFRGRLLVKLGVDRDLEEVTISSNRREAFLNWLGE